MAHKTYAFDFFRIINEQLTAELKTVPATILNDAALAALSSYQYENHVTQGVYVLHEDDTPVYVGKAYDVCERLAQHRGKLIGRQNINIDEIKYQAILLEKSMSTAVNETLLIELYKEVGAAGWNGTGFGPKDPGKERDTTEPGKFDADHPIKSNWPIKISDSDNTAAKVSAALKKQAPFVFRYKIESEDTNKPMNLISSYMPADSLFTILVETLGQGYRGAILSFGMVLYKNLKKYPYGQTIDPTDAVELHVTDP